MQGETSTSDLSVLGTHTWVAYLCGLIPSLFVCTWTLLVLAGVFNTIFPALDLLFLSWTMFFCGLFLSLAIIHVNKDLLKGGNSPDETIQRKSLISDLEFAKYYLIAGLCFSCLATVDVIGLRELNDGAIDISNVNNTTFVMTRITAAMGFLLSFFCVAKFFLTDQGSGFAILCTTLFATNPSAADDDRKRK